jgi:uncharacterized protein YwgA
VDVDTRLLPLLLASDAARSDDETEPLDRLRMQKGVFLLVQRGFGEWREAFNFVPYDWGPYSSDVASTVSRLLDEGLLEKRTLPNRRYAAYQTTPRGEAVAQKLLQDTKPQVRDFIKDTRRYVNTRSFSRLLRDVYGLYPEYAVNSRFSG